jgi:hypothetical protein
MIQMSTPTTSAVSAVSATAVSASSHGSDDEESTPEQSTTVVSGQSKAARKRKKRNANKAAAASSQHQSPPPHHQHGGVVSHSHSHEQHGGHGHSHGHSHGGVPCSGHGSDVSADIHAGVDPDDLSEAIHFCDVCYHFTSYAQHSFARIDRMQADFQTIPTVLQQLVPGHAERMGELRRAVRQNHAFLNEIVAHRYVFHSSDDIDYELLEEKVARDHPIDEERMSKVRSTLRQCVRDWSAEGASERRACYGPILDELQRLYPNRSDREQIKVLVPGSGLGRLVWEIAYLGFHAQGNEFSFFMLLCAFLILNCCKEKNIFTIYPYVHESKNLYIPDDQMRSVQIPDVNPVALPPGGSLSMAAGDWMDIFSDLPSEYIHGSYSRMQAREKRRHIKFSQQRKEWDIARKEHAKLSAAAAASGAPIPPVPELADEIIEIVEDVPRKSSNNQSRSMDGNEKSKTSNEATWDVFASCYFIDCATNILECLRTIAYILKPGGYWINFGPLLYHFSEIPRETSVDLSWSELRAAAPAFGLELIREELNQPSGYTSDDYSMLRSHYYCVSCTWKKTGVDQTRLPTTIRKNPTPPTSVAWNTYMANRNDESSWTTIAVDSINIDSTQSTNSDTVSTSSTAASSSSVPLIALLQAKGSRRIREKVSLPSGTLIDIYQLPSNQLGTILMHAPAQIAIGKIEVEGVMMLALLRKQ